MAITVINSVPFISCEDIYVYHVKTDSEVAYEADTVMYKIPQLVAVSYNVSATETPFYANSVKKLTDTTYSPTASFTLAGDDEKLEEFLFGKIKDGAALKDNLSGAPEIGIFYALIKSKGWMIRQILKATCSKADSTVNTKAETTEFQTSVTNVNPLFCEHFKSYVREFYSENEIFAEHTLSEVLEKLAAKPAEDFKTWPATAGG